MALEEGKGLPGHHIHLIAHLHLIVVPALGQLANHTPIPEATQKREAYRGAFLVLLGQEGNHSLLKGSALVHQGNGSDQRLLAGSNLPKDLSVPGDGRPECLYLQGTDPILEDDLHLAHVIDHHLP